MTISQRSVSRPAMSGLAVPCRVPPGQALPSPAMRFRFQMIETKPRLALPRLVASSRAAPRLAMGYR